MKERKLIICRGIQGSGKSTWAKQWCHESPEHHVRFNNDDIRNMLGDYWVPSREKLVTEAKANMITFALIKGYDVVVDNMNLNPKEDAWIRTLCENIQGCVLGYTQSDEITLVLIDYQKLTTDAWFDYNVQKICSVAASMATLIFNRRFQEQIVELSYNGKLDDDELTSSYKRSLKTGAMFDARCFNIPKEEVTNCILWRQQDATRNSISSAGQAHFSHKQLEGLNSNQIQELLFQEKGINWNDYPTKFKRGSCCIKKYHQTMNQTLRSYWFIDNEIPIFKGEDREYIEKLIA